MNQKIELGGKLILCQNDNKQYIWNMVLANTIKYLGSTTIIICINRKIQQKLNTLKTYQEQIAFLLNIKKEVVPLLCKMFIIVFIASFLGSLFSNFLFKYGGKAFYWILGINKPKEK